MQSAGFEITYYDLNGGDGRVTFIQVDFEGGHSDMWATAYQVAKSKAKENEEVGTINFIWES